MIDNIILPPKMNRNLHKTQICGDSLLVVISIASLYVKFEEYIIMDNLNMKQKLTCNINSFTQYNNYTLFMAKKQTRKKIRKQF